MAAGSIVIDLLMKTGSFETDTKRAEKRLRELDKTARKAGAAIGTAIVAGATAAVTALKLTIDSMDEMSKAAQRASLPTEDFSRLVYAGKLADVSMEDLTKSLGKLAKAQGDAQRGLKTQIDSFKQLGIEYKNADGSLRNTKDVFEDFADAFEKYKGSPEVVASGMQIFGRSFQTLIPLLKDGRDGIAAASDEADRLGITLSTQAGQEAEAFNDNITRLTTVLKGLVQAVASDLLPDLVELSNGFVDSASSGNGLKDAAHAIADGIRDIIQAARDFGQLFAALNEFGGKIATLQNKIAALGAAANALFRGDLDDFNAAIDQYKNASDKLAQAQKQVANNFTGGPQLQFQIPGLTPSFNATGPRVPFAPPAPQINRPPPIPNPPKTGGGSKKTGLSDAQREAERLQEQYDQLTASLQEQIALTSDASDVAKLRYELENGELSKLSPLQKQQLLDLQLLAQTRQQDAEALKEQIQAEEDHRKEVERGQENTARLISDMQFELDLMGMTNKERERAIALRYADANATDEQRKQIVGLSDALGAAHENEKIMDDFKDSLKDMFVDVVTGAKSAKEAFGDFADYLFQRSLQMLADKALDRIFSSFGQAGGSGSGSGSGGWGSLFSSIFGGARAGGGGVMASTAYLVGEQGPEMFVPRTAGTIVPSGETALAMQGGGGSTFHQTVNFSLNRRMDNRSEMQAAQAVGVRAREAMARNGG